MSSIPNKGDIVINPTTQRPVRVGSRTWLKLVKAGVMEGRYTDSNELAELPEQYEELPPEEVETKIREINKTLPKGTQAVRGRGKYAGKIVKRNKQSTPQEITEYAAKTASRVMNDKTEELDEIEYEDIEAQLEQMILTEMMGGKPRIVNKHQIQSPTPATRRRGRPRGSQKQIEHEERYYAHQAPEYDYQAEEERSEDVQISRGAKRHLEDEDFEDEDFEEDNYT